MIYHVLSTHIAAIYKASLLFVFIFGYYSVLALSSIEDKWKALLNWRCCTPLGFLLTPFCCVARFLFTL